MLSIMTSNETIEKEKMKFVNEKIEKIEIKIKF